MKFSIFVLAFALAGPVFCEMGVAPGTGLDRAAKGLVAERSLAELSSADAKRSIRGTKELWTDLSIQKQGPSSAMDSLEADLRLTDLGGQLKDAGFKVMDPKRRSLAMGLRPTLLLSVLWAPKGSEGNLTDFYLVTARATQDVTPLGGDKISMTTWMKAGEPIASTGHADKDADAIRASARACVLAFIDVAQDKDEGKP